MAASILGDSADAPAPGDCRSALLALWPRLKGRDLWFCRDHAGFNPQRSIKSILVNTVAVGVFHLKEKKVTQKVYLAPQNFTYQHPPIKHVVIKRDGGIRLDSFPL